MDTLEMRCPCGRAYIDCGHCYIGDELDHRSDMTLRIPRGLIFGTDFTLVTRCDKCGGEGQIQACFDDEIDLIADSIEWD